MPFLSVSLPRSDIFSQFLFRSFLTLKSLPLFQETPSGRKKIIPVGSDFESSPSPESPRGSHFVPDSSKSPMASPRKSISSSNINSMSNNRNSFDSKSIAEEDEPAEVTGKKKKSIGLKLKSSYSKFCMINFFSFFLRRAG